MLDVFNCQLCSCLFIVHDAMESGKGKNLRAFKEDEFARYVKRKPSNISTASSRELLGKDGSKTSVGYVALSERPQRKITTDPPTTSLNDLMNQNPQQLSQQPFGGMHILVDEMDDSFKSLISDNTGRTARKFGRQQSASYHNIDDVPFYLAPTSRPSGSMISLVTGTPATHVHSVVKQHGLSKNEKSHDHRKLYSNTSKYSYQPHNHKQVIKNQVEENMVPPDTATLTNSIQDANGSVLVQSISSLNVSKPVDSANHSTAGTWASFHVKWYKWLCLAIAACCFLAVASSSPLFLGLACGGFMMYVLLKTYTWLLNPDVVFVYLPAATDEEKTLDYSPLQNLPRNSNEAVEESVREFQGWLNLLESEVYDPETYHISNTETVFARLEDMSFRMKKPLQSDIPKRAMWNESTHNVTFVKQIQIDMRNYVVDLQPNSLSVSRIYNKRFPICLIHKKAIADINRNDQSLFLGTQGKLPAVINLFARTNREKEEWYRRLDQASRGHPITTMVLELQRLVDEKARTLTAPEAESNRCSSRCKVSDASSAPPTKENLFHRDHKELLIDYMKYMVEVISKGSQVDPAATSQCSRFAAANKDAKAFDKVSESSRRARSKSPHRDSAVAKKTSIVTTTENPANPISIIDCDTGTVWINALLHRVFFDFFREEYWRNKMQVKLQKKLNKINLPFYLGPLMISDLSLGDSLPLLLRIGQPYLSDDGLWIDSQLSYSGSAQMTLETKINLNGLKNADDKVESKASDEKLLPSQDGGESDDSSTSSEETESITPLAKDPKKGEFKITKFFNSLKESKYFQKLADTRLVKSALDKVSNTPLKLSVEVKYIAGLFSLNIPPPPTDRVWFGFRGTPELILTAKPVVGEKSVNLAKLSLWIEEKLVAEFHRELVIPNMVETKVSIMCGNYKTMRGNHGEKVTCDKL